MNPTISVVIPLYNKRPYIARAVHSIVNQEFRDWELIVVDDGSTDGSVDELAPFRNDPRIRILRSSNRGVSAARNLGLREMRAEYCAFLDADDVFLPDHLGGIAELARRYPSAGIFGTAYYWAFPDGRHLTLALPAERFSIMADYFEQSRACGFLPVCASSVAFSRRAVERVGGFLEGIGIGEDVEYYARVALDFAVAYDANPSAAYYRLTPASAMRSYRWAPDVPPVVDTVLRRVPNCPQSAVDYAAWILLKHAAAGLAASNRKGARALLNHNILAKSRLGRRRALLYAATSMPDFTLRAYLMLRNWQQDRSKGTGIAQTTAGVADFDGAAA